MPITPELLPVVDFYASWFGETDRICNLPIDQRRIEVGRMLTEIYAKENHGNHQA